MTSGVPQESILGPPLLNVYVNYFVNVNKEAKCFSYADYRSLFISSETRYGLIDMGNLSVFKIESGCDSNSLKININETK